MRAITTLLLGCTVFSIVHCQTNVGDACTVGLGCGNIPNSECVDSGSGFQCTCRAGYKANGDSTGCIPKTVGDACDTGTDCQFIANVECTGNVCTCQSGHVANAGGTTCNYVTLGGSCTGDADCNTIANAECHSVDLQCTCVTGYREDGSSCSRNIIGDSCQADEDCGTVTNSFCDSNLCACIAGHTSTNGGTTCDDNVVGSSCTTDNDCSTIANAECTGNQCTCIAGHSAPSGATKCNQIVLGDACTGNSDCSSMTNAECSGSQCLCVTGYKGTVGETECTIKDCSPPPDTEGYSLGDVSLTTYLSTVEVTCAAGYETAPDSSTIICQADETWSTPTGCGKVDCGNPTGSTGYVVDSYTTTDYESSSTMTCATGYNGTANSINCQADKSWSTPTGCTIVDCNTPTTPGYVFDAPTPNSEYLGTVAVTGCATGYEGVPDPTSLTCQASGSWVTVTGCTKIDCSTPTGSTGYVVDTYTTTNYESTAMMLCATGYEGTPNPITCQADRSWSAPTGCSIVDCGSPTGSTGYDVDSYTTTDYESTSTMSCAAGYNGTASTVTCQADKSWSSPTGCTIIDCSTPSDTEGYSLGTVSLTTYLSTVNVTCATGYKTAPDSGTIVCQADATWSTPTGCSKVDCGNPIGSAGYDVGSYTTTDYESTSTMSCATGYNGTASAITCQADKSWSSPTGCTIIDCSTPSDTEGYILGTVSLTTYLSSVNVTCATGYETAPDSGTIVCQADATWSTPTGCSKVDCGNPIDSTGYIVDSYTATDYESTSTMLCATGYNGTASTITCQADKSWSSPTGCTIVDCSSPSDTEGYSLGTVSSTEYLSTVNVTCAPGYETAPDSGTIVCQADATWSTPTGCSKVDCGNPTGSTGYEVDSYTTTDYESTSTMLCAIGYNGSASSINCQADKSWSSPTGCTIVDCLTPSDTEGYSLGTVSLTTFLSTVNVTCATGYETAPDSSTIVCQADATWSTPTGCSKVDCGNPTASTGYEVDSYTTTNYESTSTMLCATGYNGTASAITCQADKSWSSPTGCTMVDCLAPSDTEGYSLGTVSLTTYLSTVNVTCATGYETAPDSSTIVCQADATWSTPTGCSKVDCGNPTASTGYEVDSYTTTNYESTSTMLCATGYNGTASAITCQADKSWSSPTGCTMVDCLAPSDTEGYSLGTVSLTTYLSTVNVTCATGYETAPDSSTVVCQADATWSTPTGCSKVDCGNPTASTGYEVDSYTTTNYESTSTMLCATGYNGTASAITCQADKSWSSPTGCTMVDCLAPSDTQGYSLGTVSLTTYLSTMNVTCATGYETAPDSSTIVCQADATWSTPTGCNKVDCGNPTASTGYEVDSYTTTNYESTSTMLCATGYNGTASAITCQADKSWSSPTGCTMVDCLAPSDTEGYRLGTVSLTTYLSTVNVTCATGYETTPDSSTIVCQADATWSTPTGCSKVDCGNPTASTGYEVDSYTTTNYESTSTMLCATGYNGTASAITCQADKSWSSPTGCTMVDCLAPSDTQGYSLGTVSLTTYLNTVNVTCATGYETAPDSSTIVCQADATWSTPTGCSKVDCGNPTASTGYEVDSYTTTNYESTSTMLCATGYNGTASAITCQADKSWSSPTGCTMVDCLAPSDTEGYSLGTVSLTTYLSTVNVTCATGYETAPDSSTIVCQADATWSSPTGCSKVDCGNPIASTGYEVGNYTTTDYESTSTILCATGYEGTATPITCQSDKSWSSPSGCTIVDCGIPADSTGYEVGNYTATDYESTSTMLCANGYNGTANDITCQADKSWSSPTGCTIVDCSTPSNTNGYSLRNVSSTTYLSTVEVACATGYETAPDSGMIVCQADATWSTPTGCSKVDCGVPTGSTGYEVGNYTTTDYESTSTMLCANGYNGTANDITCQADKSWSSPTGCTIVDCSTPSSTEGYSLRNVSSTTYLSTVEVTCATGYETAPDSSTIVCQADATWSTPTGCGKVDCGVPADSTGYEVGSYTTTDYESTTTMLCANGYNGTANYITCQADKSWSSPTGCTAVDCLTPSDTEGYSLRNVSSTTYLSTVEVACATGYETAPDSSTIICQADATWSTPTGCGKVDCGVPADSTGYEVGNYTTTDYESSSTMLCATGYNGTANAITCQADKSWSSPTGCTIVDCSTPSDTNGYSLRNVSSTTYLSTVEVTCATGYETAPDSDTIICQADATWSTPTGCSKVDCGVPADSNGYEVGNYTTTDYDSTSTMLCAAGYNGTANPITCQADKSWSSPTGCTIVDCSTPTSSTGYEVGNYTTTDYESTSTMLCATGYNGTANPITCQADGSWSTPTDCIIVDCDTPSKTGYIYYGYTSTVYGKTAAVSCATGYGETASPTSVSCEHTGSWTEVTGCTIKECGDPTKTGYSFTDTTSTTYGGVSSVACATGFKGTPDPTVVHCESNGKWTDLSGCVIKDCGPLEQTGYTFNGNTTTYGSTLTAVCAAGYEGTATPATVTCGDSESWPAVTGCTILDCGSTYGRPENGNAVLDTANLTTYGATATQSCNTGYTAAGEVQMTCLATGQWGAVTLTCTIIDCKQPSQAGYRFAATANTTYLDIVNVEGCSSGYNGSPTTATITCGADGAWTIAEGCTPVDCTDPTVTSEYILRTIQATTFGTTVSVSCATGYTGSPAAIRCLANGQWSAAEGCAKVDCSTPSFAGYVLGTVESTKYQATVTVRSCAEGYTGSVETQEINCLATGIWSNVEGCTIVDCGQPEQPTNGNIQLNQNQRTSYGSTATQSCNIGYNIDGTTTIECLATGSWSAGVVTCTPVDCGTLVPPLFGSVAAALTTFGAIATFSCQTGYQLNGTAEKVCLSGGSWSGGDNPVCEIMGTCGDVPTITYATSTLNEAGTVVTYQCSSGYQLVNPSAQTLTCTNNQWTGTLPACRVTGNSSRFPLTFRVPQITLQNLSNRATLAYYIQTVQSVGKCNDSLCYRGFSLRIQNGNVAIKERDTPKSPERQGSDNDTTVDIAEVYSQIWTKQSGSLIIDGDIVLPDGIENTNIYLNASSLMVFNEESIEIEGQTGTLESITLLNETYTKNNVESYICGAYEYLEGQCPSGTECVANFNLQSGSAECRTTAKKGMYNPKSPRAANNLPIIIGVGVGVPLLLLLIAVFIVVGAYIRKQSRRRDKYTESESDSDTRSQFANGIATRYPGRHAPPSSGFDGPGHFEIYDNSGAADQFYAYSGFNAAYDYSEPGRKLHIKRPRY